MPCLQKNRDTIEERLYYQGGSENEDSVVKEQTILWINKHQNIWRVAILVVALVAIIGPWVFDVINVPAQYTCSAPNIRLEGDFCGTPLRGIWLLGWMVSGFVHGSAGLVSGAIGLIDWAREFLFTLLFFLVVLPFFSTLLSIRRRDDRRWQLFNIVAWGLAVGISLLLALSRYPRLFWVLWGVWLYIGLAIGALLLEVATLATGRRSGPDNGLSMPGNINPIG